MQAPQNFRSAFNGFNREDVVHYLEYINTKHQNQVNQLTAELEGLRSHMEQPDETLAAQVESLQTECTALTAQLEEAQTAKAELESRCAALEQHGGESGNEELEAYRRAERIEREAKDRADLVYFQANSVLTEAAAKVDGIAAEITGKADHVMGQLTQLQRAVSASKQALQDAASIMSTIRPNK